MKIASFWHFKGETLYIRTSLTLFSHKASHPSSRIAKKVECHSLMLYCYKPCFDFDLPMNSSFRLIAFTPLRKLKPLHSKNSISPRRTSTPSRSGSTQSRILKASEMLPILYAMSKPNEPKLHALL